jgi:acyl-coenzyme A thioesterase PaaI-like protein
VYDGTVYNLAERTSTIKASFDDACFACGTSNPLGLKIAIDAVTDGVVSGSFTPKADHQGLISQLHGGLSATALDEIMVWAGLLTAETLSVTATMQLRYRRPVPNDGAALALTAQVTRHRGKRLEMAATLSREGTPLVEATGLYLATTPLSDIL